MMEPPRKISIRHAARKAEPVLFSVGMRRADGERDEVAVRPGDKCSRAGYSRAAAGGYDFRSETLRTTCGGSRHGFNEPTPEVIGSASSALSVSTLLTIGGEFTCGRLPGPMRSIYQHNGCDR